MSDELSGQDGKPPNQKDSKAKDKKSWQALRDQLKQIAADDSLEKLREKILELGRKSDEKAQQLLKFLHDTEEKQKQEKKRE